MTITVTINGEARELADGATIAGLVESLGAPGNGRGVAVALAGEVIPRGAWASTALHADDRVEILVAVQGG